jgi:hypothetical protein
MTRRAKPGAGNHRHAAFDEQVLCKVAIIGKSELSHRALNIGERVKGAGARPA